MTSEPDFQAIERARDTPPDEWSDPSLWESADIPFDHDEDDEPPVLREET